MAVSKTRVSKKEMLYYASACACFNFRKASRAVTQLFDKTLQPVGLRSTQLVVLLAAGIYDKPTMAQLAEVIVSDRTTLTRALKPLFRRGLLENIRGTDKRKNGILLTLKGHKTIRQAVPYWRKAQNRVVRGFGQGQWNQFTKKLHQAIVVAKKN
jgi:DNA-binding MarR family transcriptional regulator